MQVIIPLAGKGTRLRPHTHLVPKPMLKVAGRPVMDWVMDTLAGLELSELIFITGHLKEQVEEYATGRYGIPCRYIEQQVQDGTAGAINLARPHVTGPVLIVFVDTVFEADLTLINRTAADGIIWAKEVEDYQRFGVVVTDAQGYMTRIVEKPKEPVSKLANIGLYYIKDTAALWQGIDHVLTAPKNQGEYFLTDAFQWMIEHGRRILTAAVTGWYDCGKLDTLLETNEILLKKGAARRGGRDFPGVTLHDPVLIEDGVTLERSTIGPNVVIETGSVVRDSKLAHTIVGADCTLSGVELSQSMLGNNIELRDFTGSASLADHSELVGSR
ncbi:MAG TPA: sugar phosphate nucleotidyltransferase [Gemmatimonadales bacterium]|jgi:glucose-1-phosphate thymidylyltransferase|nr:sugar phosphate nucleotidyltransferase [Gemmatimonadales bacterium]